VRQPDAPVAEHARERIETVDSVDVEGWELEVVGFSLKRCVPAVEPL